MLLLSFIFGGQRSDLVIWLLCLSATLSWPSTPSNRKNRETLRGKFRSVLTRTQKLGMGSAAAPAAVRRALAPDTGAVRTRHVEPFHAPT
jgi:hypothetical protein